MDDPATVLTEEVGVVEEEDDVEPSSKKLETIAKMLKPSTPQSKY